MSFPHPPRPRAAATTAARSSPSARMTLPETVKARLEVYHRETEPLKAFYAERGKLKSVENQPTIEATTAEIAKTLGIEL